MWLGQWEQNKAFMLLHILHALFFQLTGCFRSPVSYSVVCSADVTYFSFLIEMMKRQSREQFSHWLSILLAFFFASFRKDYVSKCVDYVFNTSVKAVYEEFQRGFYKLFDKEILKHFKPEELMRAIIGNTDYDWEQFEKVGNN